MSKRSEAAQRALQRAIDEGTAALQEELRQKEARIAQLEALLARICAMANVTPGEVAAAPQPVPPAPRREDLPAEVRAALERPIEQPLVDGPELAGGDNLGEGRWI